jgi:acetoin utilization deacetylase AcuC-like enzyme
VISEGEMQYVHTHQYLTRLDAACRQGYPYIDVPDSAICPESYEIAKLAAGGVVEAARMVARGDLKRAFCAVRPPGHHAESNRAMGFCLLNNIAIAACVLKTEFKLDRLLILDFDVHHCNGTQHTFEADPSVLFCSLHEHPRFLYPGTGYSTERGSGPGEGTTLNIPMMPGARDQDYETAFAEHVEPLFAEFKPQFILVSIGFDAHRADPIAHIDLTDDGYEMLTRRAVRLADQLCDGRLVSMLEGGYNLDAVGRCAVRHLTALQNKNA